MSPGVVAGVALAGAVGAPARVLLDRAVHRRARTSFPLGTVVVNVSGAFVLGLLTGLAASGHLGDSARAVLATGFCGAFTTFSTLTVETVRLARAGRRGLAVANLAVSFTLGVGAAWLGFAVAP